MPAKTLQLKPPIKGWSTARSLADMKPEYAVILDNWFPETDRLTMRNGYEAWTTGLGAPVESLMDYTPRNGTSVLFGAAGGNVYNVSGSGAVGAAVLSGKTNARWQHVNMGTSGGQFLFLFNGADAAQRYDGSSWIAASFTGPTMANLIWGNVHQTRLWVGEINSLSAWYGGTNAVTGAFTEFPLYGVFKLGGYIMGMVTWTRDGGSGADDVACFVSSEGEVAVYRGTDPSSASTWSLVGLFRIGKPIGRRFFAKFGADAVLMTQDGIVPLGSVLPIDQSQTDAVAVSDEINPSFADAVRSYGTIYGWQPIIYPKRNMAVFNAPTSTTTAIQFVFNTLSKAACRFTSIPAICFGLLGENLYFGSSDGKTYKFDSGRSDNGTDIDADCLQAFYDFKQPGVEKVWTMVEPIFAANGDPNPAVEMNTDFAQVATATVPTPVVSGSLWDVAEWDVDLWAVEDEIFRGWRGVEGMGHVGGLRLRISSNELSCSWLATRFQWFTGGGM